MRWLVPVLLLGVAAPLFAGDWVESRGPLGTGVSPEKDLPESFNPATGENVIWKVPYGGRTTPVIMNGRVYIIQGYNSSPKGEKLMEQERVLCFDEKTGELLKEYRFNVFFTAIVSDRLGWTNLAGDPETGNVYAHGTGGLLICFDKDLKPLWQHSLTEEYARVSGYGGRVVSPIVDEDKVIVGMVNASWGDFARVGNRFVAFDKKTGEVIWWTQTGLPFKNTYFSTPTVAVINGERLMLTGGGDGALHAFKVRTGEKVWSYVFGTDAVNCTPVVSGNLVYCAHGDSNPDNNKQGRVICVDASKVQNGKPDKVWAADDLVIKFASPLLHEGRLYVCDVQARMYCLDAATGAKKWKTPYTYGVNSMGSPVLADGKIFVNPVETDFVILKPGDKKAEELSVQSFPAPPGSTVGVELNGSPAVANGKIFFTTSNEFYCVGKKDHKAKADPLPKPPEETKSDGKPARIAVYPADVVLSPGESKEFTVRVLDAQGRVLKERKDVTWSVGPPPVPPPPPGQPAPATPPALKGEITKDGKLTVAKPSKEPPVPPAQFGTVQAEVDGLKASARVRVVPTLPYAPNFANVPVSPGGWVGAQGKFAVKEIMDGTEKVKVLAKNATVPSIGVARGTTYFGLPTMSDYTVQADVLAKKVGGNNGDMADVGLANQRYSLVLEGNKQWLRLMSWEALPRIDRTINFDWKPDTWYTMKLRVEQNGKTAVIKGKVWERGKAEPANWDVEFEDPLPNKEGSPGLYGYATGVTETTPGAEVYYNKVSVTPNK